MTRDAARTRRRRVVVNCRECDFVSFQPDFANADLVRDQHELEMFNWKPGQEACGPVAVNWVRDK